MEEKVETKKSGLATAGLVLGIVGICTSFIPIINNLSFFMGILSIIFGIIALIKKSGKGKTITAIILGILTIVITINSQKAVSTALNDLGKDLDKMAGNSTEELLKNDVDVSIGDFKVIKKDYLTDTKLTVKVTNKTSEKKSFSIHIEAVKKDGSRIDEDSIYASDLNPGQTQSFDIFTLVSSDKVKELKKATFKIVEVSMY